MHRFFIPLEWINKQKVTLVDETAYHIRTVLRMKVGRKVVVLDNYGQEYYVTLTHISKNVVIGEIFEQKEATGEPTTRLSLYQGTLKAQKFEWVLQKGTELGIAEFIPLICERSILADIDIIDKKIMRWERIIRQAAEQSKRGLLPELRPAMMFSQATYRANRMGGNSVLAWENADLNTLPSTLNAIAKKPTQFNLFIGSEGGFTVDEIRLAHGYNIQPISLGQRILRAETAGLVATSAIFYHFAELG